MVSTRGSLRRRSVASTDPQENDLTGKEPKEVNTKPEWNKHSRKKWRKRGPKWLNGLGVDREWFASWRRLGLTLTVLVIATLVFTDGINLPHQNSYDAASGSTSRRLLSTGASWENCDFEIANGPAAAWAVLHCFFIFVFFVSLAIVCDDFFVPSLEAISEKLNLSEDVAGATFMAAGSSAPELFTAVAGVAVQTDVGVGTIVGSAVFNIQMIIALTAALAGQVLYLDWRVLTRDSFFYAMSIICFIGFSWDGYFTHYEAIFLLLLYTMYITLMVFNARLMDWMATWKCCGSSSVTPSDEEGETTSKVGNEDGKFQENRKISLSGGHARRTSVLKEAEQQEKSVFHHQRGSVSGHNQKGSVSFAMGQSTKPSHAPTEDAIAEENSESIIDCAKDTDSTVEEEDDDNTIQIFPCMPCCPVLRGAPPSSIEAHEEGGFKNWAKLVMRWFIYILAFPFIMLFSWTIPDCSTEQTRKWYLVSFVTSVLWIAVISFGMVTLVSRVGCILGIDTYTMGLVVIAVGTSIPDCMSSILVAREGFGDMAVSNAIGSNVFDINLGIGLPFIIRICVDMGRPINLLTADEWVDYHSGKMPIVPHAKFGFVLLLILIYSFSMISLSKFKLSKLVSICFVIFYFVFLGYAFTQELYCVQHLKSYC